MGADVENVKEVYGDFLGGAALAAFLAGVFVFHGYFWGILCYIGLGGCFYPLYVRFIIGIKIGVFFCCVFFIMSSF